MQIQFLPFRDADIPEAAELLARRHQRDYAQEPALPERFTRPEEARSELEKVWQEAQSGEVRAGGVVARKDGKMLGYLIGTPRIDSVWGRSVWIDLAGHALDPNYDTELYRDLYAVLSPAWVAAGCLYHVANIPAHDQPALEAWFNLSFGKEHTYAVRETVPASLLPPPVDSELTVRRARPEDVDLAMELDQVLPVHQSRAPVYAILFPYNREEEREDVLQELHNEEWRTWLAMRNGQVVGIQIYLPPKPGKGTGLLPIPESADFLGFAATREDQQGRGIGQILTAHGLVESHARGYQYCFTDWRATNLLSSRFWTRQGWRPVVYRLTRRLDERILWSHPGASAEPWLMTKFKEG